MDDRQRMPSDGKSSHCLWQSELKRGKYKVATHYVHAFFGNFWVRMTCVSITDHNRPVKVIYCLDPIIDNASS